MPNMNFTEIKGRVWKFGDDINTDIIVPVKYLALPSVREMCKYAFEPLMPDFHSKIQPGDILVGGENWGCGSSREQAAAVLKELGVGAVVAKSFARIFYRNAFTNGLCLIEQPDFVEHVQGEYTIRINIENSFIHIENDATIYNFRCFPPTMLELLNAGGLIPYIRKMNSLD